MKKINEKVEADQEPQDNYELGAQNRRALFGWDSTFFKDLEENDISSPQIVDNKQNKRESSKLDDLEFKLTFDSKIKIPKIDITAHSISNAKLFAMENLILNNSINQTQNEIIEDNSADQIQICYDQLGQSYTPNNSQSASPITAGLSMKKIKRGNKNQSDSDRKIDLSPLSAKKMNNQNHHTTHPEGRKSNGNFASDENLGHHLNFPQSLQDVRKRKRTTILLDSETHFSNKMLATIPQNPMLNQHQQPQSSLYKKGKSLIEDNIFKKMNLLRLLNKFLDILKSNSRLFFFKQCKQNHFRIINDKSWWVDTNDKESIFYSSHKQEYGRERIENFYRSESSIDGQFTNWVNQEDKSINKEARASKKFKFKQQYNQTSNALINLLKQMISYFIKRTNSIPTLSPDNPILLIWNCILLLSTVFLLFFIPIQQAFKVLSNYSHFVDRVGTALIIFEMLLKMNTGYWCDGYIIQQRYKIVIQYIKYHIWLNLISIILLNINNYSKLLFLINVYSVSLLLEKLDTYFSFKQRFFIFYEIFRLVSLFLFIASTFGSIFYLISIKQVNYFINKSRLIYHASKIENGQKNAWILTKPIDCWQDGYVYSVYFMFITMSTVGYGDLVPQNLPEVIFVGFITLLGSCLFGYCINSIGNLLSDIQQRDSFFKQRKQDVMQYLQNRNISHGLQIKVMRYLSYLQTIESSQAHLSSEDIHKYFSENLKFEVNQEFFGKLLSHSKVFGLNFSPQFLNALAQTMKEITLAPGDILYHKNDYDNRILFVISGDIVLFEKEVKLREIAKGEILNYRGFFGHLTHSSSARSLTISHLSYCCQEDFILLLKTFPSDYETFCYLKDEIMLYNKCIDSKCCSCQSYNHIFSECPLIHYTLNKSIVIRKSNYSDINQRNSFTRNNLKFDSFTNMKQVKSMLKQYKVKLLSQMEDYSYLEDNELTEYLNDKEFYITLPSIKVSENGQVYFNTDDSFENGSQNQIVEDVLPQIDENQSNMIPQCSPTVKLHRCNSAHSYQEQKSISNDMQSQVPFPSLQLGHQQSSHLQSRSQITSIFNGNSSQNIPLSQQLSPKTIKNGSNNNVISQKVTNDLSKANTLSHLTLQNLVPLQQTNQPQSTSLPYFGISIGSGLNSGQAQMNMSFSSLQLQSPKQQQEKSAENNIQSQLLQIGSIPQNWFSSSLQGTATEAIHSQQNYKMGKNKFIEPSNISNGGGGNAPNPRQSLLNLVKKKMNSNLMGKGEKLDSPKENNLDHSQIFFKMQRNSSSPLPPNSKKKSCPKNQNEKKQMFWFDSMKSYLQQQKQLQQQQMQSNQLNQIQQFQALPSDSQIAFQQQFQFLQYQQQMQHQKLLSEPEFKLIMHLWIDEFETMKEYINYFPHNNYQTVVKNFQKLYKKRLAFSQRGKRRTQQNLTVLKQGKKINQSKPQNIAENK